MKKRLYKILTVMMAAIMLLSTSIPVRAEERSHGEYSKFNDWSNSDKARFFEEHIISIVAGTVGAVSGLIFGNTTYNSFRSFIQEPRYDSQLAEDSESYEDYVAKHYRYNEDNDTFTFDDELVDDIHRFVENYIENETGWYNVKTLKWQDINPTGINNSKVYKQLIADVQALPNGSTMFYYRDDWDISSTCPEVGEKDIAGYQYLIFDNTELYLLRNEDSYGQIEVQPVKEGWMNDSTNWKVKDENGEIHNTNQTGMWSPLYAISNSMMTGENKRNLVLSNDGHTIRVYKTLDDLKAYSVGRRPYYASSTYYNYDSSRDNTTTLTNSQLQNSSLYGDVQNIVNNIENGDSLTEDELRDILDDYFNRLYNINPPSGGGGNGNGNDSSSGGGLGGLLSGIGALLETLANFVGRLIEMIAEVFNKLLDRFVDVEEWCTGFSELVGSFFPYVPEEIIDIVCLGLTVSIIIAIIKAFKG